MKIPTYANSKFVDDDGYLTPGWMFTLNQLFDTLQNNASDNSGLVVPKFKTAQIAQLVSAPDGTLVYNKDLNILMVKKNGTFVEV
jgi:hypothetical protein